MLEGTRLGLERYINFKKRMWRWKYHHLLNYLKYRSASLRSRLNVAEHIDEVYCSIWDISEQEYILDEYKRIRLGEVLPNSITRKIRRFYNDQTVYYEKGFRRFEPSDCQRTLDRLTDQWLTWLTQMHVGQEQVMMSYISQGTGTTTADRTDTDLEVEVIRRHILDNGGYIDSLGHNELYGLIFPFSQADILCTETGLHNTDLGSPGVMACRNNFNPGLNHSANANGISINVVIQHRAF